MLEIQGVFLAEVEDETKDVVVLDTRIVDVLGAWTGEEVITGGGDIALKVLSDVHTA